MRTRLLKVFLSVLIVALCAACAGGSSPGQAQGATPGYTGQTFVYKPTVAFFGDSFTGGSAMAAGDQLWWYKLCVQLNCTGVNFGLGGTGYITPYKDRPAMKDRVAAVAAARPDEVVLASGHNDQGTTAEVTAGAKATIDGLKQALPDARLALLSPFCSGDCTAAQQALTSSLAQLAATEAVPYFDVSAVFAGSRVSLIGSDKTHPTPLGNVAIANAIAPGMKSIIRPVEVYKSIGAAPSTVSR